MTIGRLSSLSGAAEPHEELPGTPAHPFQEFKLAPMPPRGEGPEIERVERHTHGETRRLAYQVGSLLIPGTNFGDEVLAGRHIVEPQGGPAKERGSSSCQTFPRSRSPAHPLGTYSPPAGGSSMSPDGTNDPTPDLSGRRPRRGLSPKR
jgi:hypothetical protein